MELNIFSRAKHAWNAFVNNRDPTDRYQESGVGYSYRPDRPRLSRGNERSIVTAIYNRIATDVAQMQIKHCRLDEDDRFIEEIDSGLNTCLNLEANLDQTGRAFMQDAVMSMLDEGCVGLLPTTFSTSKKTGAITDITSMRTAKVITWYPKNVRVRAYNEETGNQDEIVVPKRMVSIVENPFFAVMNEPNSTLQRLIRKLNLLDFIDEQSGSGKLDLIIQLPYVIKTEARRKQAEDRRKDIENQLSGSKYGIAYTDGTERITQLNRPVENNLMKQIEFLTNTLYGQLGITQAILDGTADEKTMLNYYNRTVEPIIAAIVDEMKRKFLSKTARSQLQSICYFRDPFKLAPINDLAELGDKFTRNKIMTSNEMRQVIGMKPSKDPSADKLENSNIRQPGETSKPAEQPAIENEEGGNSQNGDDV